MNILLLKAFHNNPYYKEVAHPLGIMYLAGILRLHKNYNVKILDLRLYKKPYIIFERVLESFNPDLIGISALSVEFESMNRLAKIAKTKKTNLKVVVGGPQATSYPEITIKNDCIDYCVVGEGEEAFAALLNAISLNESIENIKGIVFKQNGKIIHTPSSPWITNLDAIPFPAWDLIELDKYKKFKSTGAFGGRRYATIFTSRGCPFHCIYCLHIFGEKFRARSPASVINEIKYIIERFNITEFEIVDDIYNFDKKRIEEICNLIIEKKIKISLVIAQIRADLLDKDLLEKLKLSGVIHIGLSIESASNRIQKLIKRNLDLKKVNEIIDYAYKLKIFTIGLFIVGFPTETEEEILDTISFAVNTKLTAIGFFLLVPFEGTELWNAYAETISKFNSNIKDLNFYSYRNNLSLVPQKKLLKLRKLAYRKFYLNIKRIVNIIRLYPYKRFLVKMGIGTLRRSL